ncbi:MAG: hypothetical protein KGI06_06135, partial [Candidatus Micrarchaeota archaeon]|nr:hypothetical protein [Candidatus Micrarchaeota archaeon]
VAVQKVDYLYINTINGTPQSSVKGQDLYDFNMEGFQVAPYISTLSSTNQGVQAFSLPYFFNPFMYDYTENFGVDAGILSQIQLATKADVSNRFQSYVFDMYLEGVDSTTRPTTNGYIKMTRDEETSTAGQTLYTKVYGKRLLGIFNFMTNFIDNLSANAAINTTTIRNQAITFSRSVVYGPFTPMRALATQAWQVNTTSPPILNNADHFQDLGMHNRMGPLGVNIAGNNQVEIQTTGGDANAYRTYGVILVDKQFG